MSNFRAASGSATRVITDRSRNRETTPPRSTGLTALRKITSYAWKLARARDYKRCVVFLGRALWQTKATMRWIDYIEHFGERSRLGRPSIELVRKSLATYFIYGKRPAQTCDLLIDHFEIAAKAVRHDRFQQLWSGESFELATVAGKKETYRILMRRADQSGARHEGEITLSLVGPQFEEPLCRMTFIFTRMQPGDHESNPTVAVGSLQGSARPDCKPAIIAATRDLNGLRPKDALLLVVKGLAHRLGASEIHAVGNQNHVINRRRASRRRRMWADLDSYWIDRGGIEDGPFGYVLEVEDLPSEPLVNRRAEAKLAFWNIGATEL